MVTVILNGSSYQVDPHSDQDLMHQLKEQGAEIIAACNGAGICQTCAVVVKSGELTPPSETEELMSLPEGQRMTCQCNAKTDCDLELLY